MLLMDIVTWEPKDSEKVKNCYMNYEYPKGLKVIDEWIDLTGYRMFLIYEADDEKAYAAANLPFIGLCRFETFPVMKAEKYMQLAQELAEKSGGKGVEVEALGEGAAGEEIRTQIENLEKRIYRLEHHSFIQQEDTT
ncbi:hypothetical protein EO98_17765 [Methanosarcina sp. 2.H.T.1A.6]|uniref:DUF3303 domain-containing protein n=1 Tax=unclassified Methanosarcina TaxID=2644672 RepID=UPI000621BE13|nr:MULTISPECIES: DUF3303 family protein [unclassified Methanosarcina]KKG09924.1 hypothetical protein EO97_19030 [Methanosarcina sp. 2.H.T.1A.15]KKG15714.1 hypothetical protein EO94_01495 [Methanosarcina sp. 2.H.T.1A.3]KKG24593.1 hypothetical protein EO98_17765 [Methanosarcina sp. 2.H.T.1A.6]KKG25809.1 hypothetical protein EO96_19475 [Methanosarcina sp. 2.H.T.1A.8]